MNLVKYPGQTTLFDVDGDVSLYWCRPGEPNHATIEHVFKDHSCKRRMTCAIHPAQSGYHFCCSH